MQARFAPVGVEVIYAIPYNAQAKLIERMFRTFRHRFDEDFEAYRGTHGEKSELARELYYQSQRLPTISELAYLLQLAIGEYNSILPHGGRGMDGRTPDQVFYDESIRIPRRNPDKAFALLFFEPVKGGRIVGRNGISHQKRTYRLASLEKHLEYFGERVDLRINPDDERMAIVLSRTTGAYVCDAILEEYDATYSTRDQITRGLIERVFRDGRELQRMAAAHVEGAEERFGEYRRARIAYLKRRLAEVEAQRQQEHLCAASGGDSAVVMIPQLSAAACHIELTASAVAAVLAQDEERESKALCIVSPRRQPKAKARANTRPAGYLTYAEIAARLGITRKRLLRYRSGEAPWPEGMEAAFEALDRRRSGMPAHESEAEIAALGYVACERSRRFRGDASLAALAAQLGVSRKSLLRYRAGTVPWPEGG